jgi:hypothetical protein
MTPIDKNIVQAVRCGTCLNKVWHTTFSKAVKKLLTKHQGDFGAHIYKCRFSIKNKTHWHIGHRREKELVELPRIAFGSRFKQVDRG